MPGGWPCNVQVRGRERSSRCKPRGTCALHNSALVKASRLEDTDSADPAWTSPWEHLPFGVPRQEDLHSCGVIMLLWMRDLMATTAQGKSVTECKVRPRAMPPRALCDAG